MKEPEDDLRPDLVDLTGLDLEAIDTLPDSVFAAALARIYRELNGVGEPFCVHHQSSATAIE